MSEQKAMDLWYEFDNFFMFLISQEIQNALRLIGQYTRLRSSFYFHMERNSFEEGFLQEFGDVKDPIALISSNITKLLDRHFRDSVHPEYILMYCLHIYGNTAYCKYQI